VKTLYSILGVGVDASAEEITVGYQRMLAMYPEPMLLDDERRGQLVALREAYATLSDPVRRSLYDQQRRLSMQSPYRGDPASSRSMAIKEVKVSGAVSLIKILAAGVIVIVALLVYTSHNKEQQRLRLEKEREVELKRIQIEEERQQLVAAEHEARLARQKQTEQAAAEERFRRESQQAIREAESRQRQFDREEEARRRQEASERKQLERDAEYQRQRAQQDLDRQAARLRALARSR
jgi:curved DNA-binding protein CbpA